MRRRAMMKTVGVVATTSTAGCMGGGEVVTEIQRRVTVEPGRYWSRELPDVSDPGGSIEYVLGGDRAFDLLFFTGGEDFTAYREALRGEEPDRTPTGHDEFSETAAPSETATATRRRRRTALASPWAPRGRTTSSWTTPTTASGLGPATPGRRCR